MLLVYSRHDTDIGKKEENFSYFRSFSLTSMIKKRPKIYKIMMSDYVYIPMYLFQHTFLEESPARNQQFGGAAVQ